MRYQTTTPLTAMQIRDKVRLVKEASEVEEVRVFVRGCWTAWVNGDEYGETTIDFPRFVEVTNIGTRYIGVVSCNRAVEFKPELCEEGFELVVEPTNPLSRLEGLPPTLITTYVAINKLVDMGVKHSPTEVLGVAASSVASALGETPVRTGIFLELLEELGFVKIEVVNKKKVVSLA